MKKRYYIIPSILVLLIAIICLRLFSASQQVACEVFYGDEPSMLAVQHTNVPIEFGNGSKDFQDNLHFKAKKKIKIKVRYRAMYCQLRLTPFFNKNKPSIASLRLVLTYTSTRLTEALAFHFTLRGPPAHSTCAA